MKVNAQKKIRRLLFNSPTNELNWMESFKILVDNTSDWDFICQEIIEDEYYRNAEARDGYARVGWYLLMQGDAKRSLLWFQKDISYQRIGWWLGLRYAEVLAQVGKIEPAIEQVAKVYDEYPEARNGYAMLAWRQHGTMLPGDALEWVDRDVRYGRLTPGFAINHAVLLAQTGRWPDAIAMVERCYDDDPGMKNGFARLGWIYKDAGNWTAAWEIAKRDLQLRRLSAVWMGNLALLLGLLGKFDHAEKLIDSAYAEDKSLKDFNARLGQIKAKEKDWKNVFRLVSRDHLARRLSPVWKISLAQLYKRRGDISSALNLIESAIAGLASADQKGVARFNWNSDDANEWVNSPNLVVFFGHHKCGSRFFRFSVMKSFAETNMYDLVGYVVKDQPFHFRLCHELDLFNIDFESLRHSGPTILNLSNSGADVVEKIKQIECPFRGIHLLRDPRQLLVSNYFHHVDGHDIALNGWVWDELASTRTMLKSMNLEDGLFYELDHITSDVMENQILPWNSNDSIIEFKLETFNDNFHQNIRKIAEHCGFARVPDIVIDNIGSNQSTPSWRNVLTKKIKKAIKNRYGDWLIDSGYEKDNDW
jgi:tetratricopeptide (TPR) repeat protein